MSDPKTPARMVVEFGRTVLGVELEHWQAEGLEHAITSYGTACAMAATADTEALRGVELATEPGPVPAPELAPDRPESAAFTQPKAWPYAPEAPAGSNTIGKLEADARQAIADREAAREREAAVSTPGGGVTQSITSYKRVPTDSHQA